MYVADTARNLVEVKMPDAGQSLAGQLQRDVLHLDRNLSEFKASTKQAFAGVEKRFNPP